MPFQVLGRTDSVAINYVVTITTVPGKSAIFTCLARSASWRRQIEFAKLLRIDGVDGLIVSFNKKADEPQSTRGAVGDAKSTAESGKGTIWFTIQ
jgi:hypothetical protein